MTVNLIPEIVDVTVSIESAPLTPQAFGRAMILGVHSVFGDRFRLYTSLAGMVDDGFATTDPEYLEAQAMLAQAAISGKRVTDFLVGRRATPVAQVRTVTIATVTNGAVYALSVNGESFSYTADSSAADTEIRDGLLAAIAGGSQPVTGASTGANTFTITADNPGEPFTFAESDAKLTSVATTANVGAQEDLIAIDAAGAEWYALLTTSRESYDILQAAAWVESAAQPHIYLAQSSDAGMIAAVYDPNDTTTDIGSRLKGLAYNRTALFYHEDDAECLASAAAGRVLPANPGTATWALKSLVGVTADALTATQRAYLTGTKTSPTSGKNVNVYIALTSDVSITERGMMAAGRYIDVQHTADWLQSQISTGVANLMLANPKIPFDDTGIQMLASVPRGVLARAKDGGILASDKEVRVTAPKSSDITSSNKTNRILDPPITCAAVLSGAIHYAQVAVKLTA